MTQAPHIFSSARTQLDQLALGQVEAGLGDADLGIDQPAQGVLVAERGFHQAYHQAGVFPLPGLLHLLGFGTGADSASRAQSSTIRIE